MLCLFALLSLFLLVDSTPEEEDTLRRLIEEQRLQIVRLQQRIDELEPPVINNNANYDDNDVEFVKALDQNELTIGFVDNTVAVWHTVGKNATTPCMRLVSGHDAPVVTAHLLPDGDGQLLLATGSMDKTVKVWDLRRTSGSSSRCPLLRHTLRGHSDWIASLDSISSAADGGFGLLLASGSADHTIRVWHLAADGECTHTLVGHSHQVSALKWRRSGGGGQLVSASWDRSVRVWHVESGQCVRTLIGHKHFVCSLELLSTHKLASGSADHTIRVWNLANGECVRTLAGHTYTVFALLAIGDRLLASGGGDRTVRVWDVSSGECVHTLRGHEAYVSSLALVGDDQDNHLMLASGSDDRTVRVWRLDDDNVESVSTVDGSRYARYVHGFRYLTHHH